MFIDSTESRYGSASSQGGGKGKVLVQAVTNLTSPLKTQAQRHPPRRKNSTNLSPPFNAHHHRTNEEFHHLGSRLTLISVSSAKGTVRLLATTPSSLPSNAS